MHEFRHHFSLCLKEKNVLDDLTIKVYNGFALNYPSDRTSCDSFNFSKDIFIGFEKTKKFFQIKCSSSVNLRCACLRNAVDSFSGHDICFRLDDFFHCQYFISFHFNRSARYFIFLMTILALFIPLI